MYEVRLFITSRNSICIAFYFHSFHSSAVPVEHAASSSIERRVAPDGIAYSWAEFDNYSDTDMATEIWKASVCCSSRARANLELASFRTGLHRSGRCRQDTWHPSHAR